MMLELLNKFQEQKTHLALVTDDPERVTQAWEKEESIPPHVHMAGILTIEDIFEQILQEEVDDEADASVQHSRSFWNSISARRTSIRRSTRKSSRGPEWDGEGTSGLSLPLLPASE